MNKEADRSVVCGSTVTGSKKARTGFVQCVVPGGMFFSPALTTPVGLTSAMLMPIEKAKAGE